MQLADAFEGVVTSLVIIIYMIAKGPKLSAVFVSITLGPLAVSALQGHFAERFEEKVNQQHLNFPAAEHTAVTLIVAMPFSCMTPCRYCDCCPACKVATLSLCQLEHGPNRELLDARCVACLIPSVTDP